MRVSTLTGPLLNLWVAKADKRKVRVLPAGDYPFNDSDTEIFFHQDNNGYLYPGTMGLSLYSDIEEYSPSTDWSQGGTIIEREKIESHFNPYAKTWIARYFDDNKFTGETLLIAAMRCYVASKFGNEVDDS